MHNELTALGTGGVIIAVVIQWIKGQSWFPWITAQTEKVNRIVAVALSFLASIGVHVQFESDPGVLTITGLTLATLVDIFRDAIVTWASAKGYYKLLLRNGA